MTNQRQNDSLDVPHRTPRCYNVNGLWYFELRGGGQHGPYDTEADMESALQEFIALHEAMKSHV